jgi:putative transposase
MSEVERLTYTYSGTSIADKPARMMRNEKYHKIVFEQLLKGVALTVEQAHFILAQWFDEYANRPHTDGYYKGIKPSEIFLESLENVKQLPDFTNRLLAKEQLNYLMLEESVTTLYRRGIRFNGNEYFHESFYSLEKGKEKVTFKIKYDRDNADAILVFDDKGKFLCEATKKEYLHPLANYYGTPQQITEYQNQVNMQKELKQLTTSQFKDHFENVLVPELPASMKKLEETETAKLEKRGRIVRKVSNSDLDFGISDYSNSNDEPDFKI